MLWGLYVVAGVILSARMLREGVGGRRPWGFAVYRDELYTPEGQRLLGLFRKWYSPSRVVLVLVSVGVAGGLFCNLVGW